MVINPSQHKTSCGVSEASVRDAIKFEDQSNMTRFGQALEYAWLVSKIAVYLQH